MYHTIHWYIPQSARMASSLINRVPANAHSAARNSPLKARNEKRDVFQNAFSGPFDMNDTTRRPGGTIHGHPPTVACPLTS